MEKHAVEIKAAISGFFAFLTFLWGWFGWLVIAFTLFMFVDYITGSAVAKKNENWKSRAARQGIAGKGFMILVVACAGIMDLGVRTILQNIPAALPFEYTTLLCPVVLVWYIITEFGSILENILAMDVRIPPFLKPVIKGMKQAVEISVNVKDNEE